MRWAPAADEEGKWRGERKRQDAAAGIWWEWEHLASVEVTGAAPLIGLGREYAAEVVVDAIRARGRVAMPFYRAAPTLFASLKEAQLWCEREVKMLELRELV
mgnify:CR=1 FL=1